MLLLSLVEGSSNTCGQICLRNGLLYKINASIEPTLVHHGITRIPGHVHNLEARPEPQSLARKLFAVFTRHNDVGEHQVYGAVGLRQHNFAE